jgi:hypothetical protein
MRDSPYPARFFGRLVDEPVFHAAPDSLQHAATIAPLQPPLSRLLLLLMTLYLCCALFLIFTVSSYAAPMGNATWLSPAAEPCIESMVAAAGNAAH